ncbi:class I SAM-dependent methyltransferase [Erythrobacter sp. NFXS35]|uniref:class I SAM-dependent methyltransferase n=1 Tax=Erythrobacter sp. NFXS35 TaxID=2818436 RepID=UPI0032DE6AA0
MPPALASLLIESAAARPVDDHIWSVLAPGEVGQRYDGRARAYDALIGNRLYNALAWGTSPTSYAAFARAAARHGSGPLLDAGCGTLVSTAAVHAGSGRLTVLVDLSLDMLAAGRDRIRALTGGVADHLWFLQADLNNLPFRKQAFGAVLNPGMLHLFADFETVTAELARVTAPEGAIFLSSLVDDRWLGARYLALLHRAGEVAVPRSFAQLTRRLNASGSGLATPVDARREGNMAFVTAQPAG